MNRIFEKRGNEIRAVLWGGATLFLALCLVSFNSSDPSFNSSGKIGAQVHNLCGYFGSFLSDLLYQGFGLSSWGFVLFGIKLSHSSFRGKKAAGFKSWQAVWGVCALLLVSALMGLYFSETKMFQNQIPVPGVFGLLFSKAFTKLFNSAGAAIILWLAVFILAIVSSDKSLSELMAPIAKTLTRIGVFFKAAITKRDTRDSQIAMAAEQKISQLVPLFKINDSAVLEQQALRIVSASEEEAPESGPSTISIAAIREKILGAEKTQKKKIETSSSKRLQIENWELPSIDLLSAPPLTRQRVDEKEIARNAKLVEQKLAEFDVTGQVVEVRPGPAVTMYEFKPAASVKISDITKLTDDLSLALSAESLRMIAPIPGRDVVGIETSNSRREPIFMKELVQHPDFWSNDIKLPIVLGKGVAGDTRVVDLRKMPHLLVAGTTGSGKSVFISSLLTSLILRHSPKTLRLVIVDPKQVDMVAFHKVPHLLLPAVKEPRPAVNTLKWLIREMERRYRSMARFNAKNLELFNEAVGKLTEDERKEHVERVKTFEENPATKMQNYYFREQPYIVAVIEEFADLMTVDKAGVEPAVVRLAQMARASGIHLVIAMQSPRREVLTGLIKTNFPARISFKVASKVDSQIILDERGAERLLSVGDMLFRAPGMNQANRFHGAFLNEEEIGAVTSFWTDQGSPDFEPTAVASAEANPDFGDGEVAQDDRNPDNEEGYDSVVAFVSTLKEVSASLLQRRFRYGYPKAARLIEIMEKEGVVGPSNGSKPRSVLANRME